MEELVLQVAKKTGISEEQARTAANAVIAFLKERLPEPIAGHIDEAIGLVPTGTGNLTSIIHGMFGGKE